MDPHLSGFRASDVAGLPGPVHRDDSGSHGGSGLCACARCVQRREEGPCSGGPAAGAQRGCPAEPFYKLAALGLQMSPITCGGPAGEAGKQLPGMKRAPAGLHGGGNGGGGAPRMAPCGRLICPHAPRCPTGRTLSRTAGRRPPRGGGLAS